MHDDPSGSDPKRIWQNQPAEPVTITLEMIRQRARELHAKTRRELFRDIALALIVVALCGSGFVLIDDLALRSVFALAVVWVSAGQYFLHRGMWRPRLQVDAALHTSLEFCRQEIERRHRLYRITLQWSIGPLALTIAALAFPLVRLAIKRSGGPPVQMIPFFTLLILWIVGVFVIRFYRHRQLRREIAELSDIENSGRS